MDLGLQPTDGIPDGGVPLTQSPQQSQSGSTNAFAGDSGGGVFMGVSYFRSGL
jgi:hypothetical protein